MAKANKQPITLDNGAEVLTTKDGWSDEYIQDTHALCAGWGSNPHFGLNQAFLVAVGKELPEYVLGEIQGKKVLDPVKLSTDIVNLFIETKDLTVEKIRIAGSRAPKLTPELKAMKDAMDASPEMQEIFKTSNPEMYAKLYPEDDSDEELEE